MNNRHYTEKELNEMKNLKDQGASYTEIAQLYNRSGKAIQLKFSELGWTNKRNLPSELKKDECAPASQPSVAKKPSLSDFLPRDIIKYLYNLGYRIENNRLVFVQKTVIDMKKILEDK